MISDKRIKQIVDEKYPSEPKFTEVCMERAIKQALAEAEPLIREDEREKVIFWLNDDKCWMHKSIVYRNELKKLAEMVGKLK